MIEISERSLSSAARRRLQKLANYHGSPVRHRIGIAAKATAFFAALAGPLLGLSSLFALLGDSHWSLSVNAPSVFLGGMMMYGLVLAIALWESRTSHDALNERKRFAELALAEGKETLVMLRLDEESACFEHEHGTLFILNDGAGGSVLVDVATQANDPLEKQARSNTVSLEWRLRLIGGQIQHAAFSRERIAVRRQDGLDRLGDTRASEVVRKIGLQGNGVPLRVPVDAKEVFAKVAAKIDTAGDTSSQ